MHRRSAERRSAVFDRTATPARGSAVFDRTATPARGSAVFDRTATPARGSAVFDRTATPARGSAVFDRTATPARGSAVFDRTATPARGSAVFDRTGHYRYALVRAWDARLPRVAFVMLNPSTADARRDDPTIRRCIGFARAWGFGSLEVVNLFAWRATKPRALRRARDPVGPRNDAHVRAAARRAARVVLAWGNDGALLARSGAARARLCRHRDAVTFGATKRGEPCHPLYLRASAPLVPAVAAAR